MRPQFDSVPNLFLIWFKIINKKLYTDTDDFDIPVGSEIIPRDGMNAMEIRNRLMKYASSDGFNETKKKDHQREMEFGILHFYEFGAKPAYQVEYKTPSNEVMTNTVESQFFESIGKRFTKRNSFLARQTLSEKGPHLYFKDSLKQQS